MNRSRGKYDITLDDGTLKMGFSLAHETTRGGLPARPAVVTSEYSPARLDDVARNADVPRVIDNLDAGMGYSRRMADVPNGYAYCLPGYTRAPGGIFSPAGKVTEITLPAAGSWESGWLINSERFGTSIYVISQGRHVLKLSDDGTHLNVDHTFPVGWECRGMAIFNNRLYVSGGGAGLAYLDGATGVWSAVAAVPRSQLAVASWRPLGVPTEVLIGVSPEYGENAIRWCPITADPMVDTDWSAPVRVGGDSRYFIHELVAAPQHVYMLRPDGIWDMDELGARTFNIAPWAGEALDYFSGSWGMHVGDGVYYSHGLGLAFVPTGGETQYRPEWIHPAWGLPYEGPVRGAVTAGTLHNGWGLVSMLGPTESYIAAGRRDPTGQHGSGPATHVWHGAEAVVPGYTQHLRVYALAFASGWPQLLITTVDGTGVRAFWQSLSKTDSPLSDLLWGGGFVPADAGSLLLPADPWDRPSAVKTMLQFEMVTERLNLGSDVLKVYASADQGTWAEQGTAEVGTYTELAPLELVEGRSISVRVDAIGSPVLRSIDLRAAVGVQLREVRVYRVILGYDNALSTPRGREHRDPEQRMIDLRSMLGRVVVLEDPYPMRVRVLQVMAPERRALGAPNRAGAWSLVVPVMVSMLDHPFRFEGVGQYDTDRTWG